MLTLSRSYQTAGDGGVPLRTVFPELAREGAHFRLGEFSMVVASPGVAKTTFALNLAWKIRDRVETALYFSPDTPPHDFYARCCAMVTGDTLNRVQWNLQNGMGHIYADVAKHFDHVRFDADPILTYDRIREQLDAFAILFGDYPHMLVIDCLRNMSIGDDDDFAGFRHGTEALAKVARDTGSCVVALHHLVGSYANGNTPPTLASIEGKVDKHASLILGLFNRDDGMLGVSILKNRSGPCSPQGNMVTNLPMDLSRMRIGW